MCGKKQHHQKELFGLLLQETHPSCSVSPPFLSAESGGVFEKIVVLPLQEMKCGAYNCTVTKKSMIPVLKHVYTHSCAHSRDKQHLRLLPLLREGLFRKHHLHSAQLFIIKPYRDFITWFLQSSYCISNTPASATIGIWQHKHAVIFSKIIQVPFHILSLMTYILKQF